MSNIQVNLFDGDGLPLPTGKDVLISLRQETRTVSTFFDKASVVSFRVDFDKERPDRNNYSVLASAGYCSDVGFFPVTALDQVPPVGIDLMLRLVVPASISLAQAGKT